MTYPIMPALHGYSIHKRPTFATTVRVPRSGREVTRFQQTLPLWEFELVYEVLGDQTQNSTLSSYFSGRTEFQQIAGLFAACGGEYGFFYFEDLSDNSRDQQPLGLGDGVTTDFRLLRTISYGDIEYTEPVGGINLDESIVVYVNDIAVPQLGNWGISADLRFLVFDTPPAAPLSIKITFYYRYLCRFISNEAEFEEFLYNRWTQKGLRFRSINLYSSGFGIEPPFSDPLEPPIPPTPENILPAGKYYWEVTIDVGAADGTNGYGIHSGVCMPSTPLTGTVATAINIPQGPGGCFINWRAANPVSNCNGWGDPVRMGGIAGGEPLAVGEKIGFALDTINKKLWTRNVSLNIPLAGGWAGGVSQSGNPVTNSDGADLAANGLTGALFIICGASHGAGLNHGIGTINFGGTSFTGTIPAGFVSISSVLAEAALNPDDNSNIALSNSDRTFSGENVPVTFSPPISGFSTNVGYSNSVRSNFSILQV